MTGSIAFGIYLVFGLGLSMQLSTAWNASSTDDLGSFHTVKVSSNVSGPEYGYAGFPIILMAKDIGKAGNGNGDNGDDAEDKKDGKNGEEGEESEGFDRLWDVILYG